MNTTIRLVNKNIQKPNYLNFFRNKELQTNLPIITISREKGAGGRIIAQRLAKKLGNRWKVYHREIVDQIASETKIEIKRVQDVDEKEVPYMDEVIGSLFGEEYLSLSRYHQSLLKVLNDIGNHGYAIIIGRGANFLFKNALKVRIIADTKQRVHWLMKYEKLTEGQAMSLIKKSDKERSKFTEDLFSQDINNPENYDLTIKTGDDLSIDDAVEILFKLIKKKFH